MYSQMSEVLARARCAEIERASQRRIKSRSSLRIMLDARRERRQSSAN